MERLRPKDDERLLIRFHHLVEWQDMVLDYFHTFPVNPWEIPEKNFRQVRGFIRNYVLKDYSNWEIARSYLEDMSTRESAKKLNYVYDLMGVSSEDKRRVTSARIKLYEVFFNLVKKDKNTRFCLTLDSDGYCKTCAIGAHCQRSQKGYERKNDRDYVFQNSFERLLNRGYRKNGIGKDETGNPFITGETLFDKFFYRTLLEDIRLSGNGEWL